MTKEATEIMIYPLLKRGSVYIMSIVLKKIKIRGILYPIAGIDLWHVLTWPTAAWAKSTRPMFFVSL